MNWIASRFASLAGLFFALGLRLTIALSEAMVSISGFFRRKETPKERLVEAPTPEELAVYGSRNHEAATLHKELLGLWSRMADEKRVYYMTLYDENKDTNNFKVWLENAPEDWIVGRVCVFETDEEVNYYIAWTAQNNEKEPTQFRVWKAKYLEIVQTLSGINDAFVKDRGKGIRADLCYVGKSGDIILGDTLWDKTTH